MAADPPRCGAKKGRGRGICQNRPPAGKTRCRFHGGMEGQLPPSTIHGRSGKTTIYARLSEAHQRELAAALTDPQLLDVRRGVALGQVVLQNAPLLPSDEALTRSAQRANLRSMPRGAPSDEASAAMLAALMEVDEADLELARMMYADRSMQLIERFHRRQVDALKQIELGRLMRESVLPMLQEMGLRVGRLVHQYVEEKHRDAFVASFRTACIKLVAELSELRDQ